MKTYLRLFLACAVVVAAFLLGGWYAQNSPDPSQAIAADSAATVKDPVCGMAVDKDKAEAAGRKSEYQKKTYYFCSDHCKKEFDKDPAKYLKAKAEPGQMAVKHIDPICGKEVDPATAHFKSEYKGKTYYFCNESCKKSFDADPQKFEKKS